MITTLSEESFEVFIQREKPVLVDFWAAWCAPCMMQGKVLEELEEEYPELVIGKVNVDECGNLAHRFGVDAIPTLIFFREGKPLERVEGLRQGEELLEYFRDYGEPV